MIEQLKTIRAGLRYGSLMEQKQAAFKALTELEAMVGAQEPVAWIPPQDGRWHWSDSVQAYRTEKAGWEPVFSAPVAQQYEAGDVASAAAQGFRDGVASVAQQPQGEVVVTWNEQHTRILAVTRQDREGRILSVIAEAPAQQPQAEAVPPDVEVIRKALELAFIMGQNYWADADSESYSANKRSDVTRQKFNAMRDEVCAAIAQQKGQP